MSNDIYVPTESGTFRFIPADEYGILVCFEPMRDEPPYVEHGIRLTWAQLERLGLGRAS